MEKKKVMKYAMLIVLAVFVLAGCEYYSETDKVAKTTWSKMNAKEKIYYDKVESKWKDDFEDKKLLSVRAAVRARKIKPDERAIPFIDIADIIVVNNDMTLQTGSDEASDKVKEKNSAKWDSIDTDWYRIIVSKYRKNSKIPRKSVKENGTQTVATVVSKEITSEQTLAASSYDYEVESTDLLPESEYLPLKRKIRSCPEAQELLGKIVMEKRALTLADREALIAKFMICKTRDLHEKMTY